VQGSLVRVTKAAEGCEVLVRKVLAVVLEYEGLIFDAHGRFRGAGVIGVL